MLRFASLFILARKANHSLILLGFCRKRFLFILLSLIVLVCKSKQIKFLLSSRPYHTMTVLVYSYHIGYNHTGTLLRSFLLIFSPSNLQINGCEQIFGLNNNFFYLTGIQLFISRVTSFAITNLPRISLSLVKSAYLLLKVIMQPERRTISEKLKNFCHNKILPKIEPHSAIKGSNSTSHTSK